MHSSGINRLSGFGGIEYQCYKTLYQNVFYRLVQRTEVLNHDLMGIGCPDVSRFRGGATLVTALGVGNYIVVGNDKQVVVMFEADDAVERNLPYIAVWDGLYFRPYLGRPADFWNQWMEPARVELVF